ncbi:MAG: PaaI family thioesterase [Dehalococcoidia bacterium]|nr:PaaI family thioesterase [Dehalococcoidia bacterium]
MEDNENWASDVTIGYPPLRHILRDLRMSVEFQGDRCVGRVPIVPEVCTDRGGVQVGVLATLVDTAGGALAIRNIYPDWLATASLSVYMSEKTASGTLVANGGIVREGRNVVVVEVDILEENAAGDGRQTGSAVMTLVRLPRRQDAGMIAEESAGGVTSRMPGTRLSASYLEMVRVRIVDPASGALELEMHEYIRNSFGVLHGGIVALLGDQAGEQAARAVTGKPLTTRDLTVHYLSQGKVGPFRTRARVLRATPDTVLSRVEAVDAGAGDRLVCVAMNTAALE